MSFNSIKITVLLTIIISLASLPGVLRAAPQGAGLEEIEVFGTAVPQKKIEVAPLVGGIVENCGLMEGDTVKAGDRLFTIEKKDYELQYALAGTNVEKARVSLNQAAIEFERMKKLYALKSISRQIYDNAAFNYKSAQAGYEAAKASYNVAATALKRTEVFSPVSGIVSVKCRENGDFVDRGKPVFELLDIGSIKARLKVPEGVVSKISKGDRLEMVFDAYEGMVYTGSVCEIKPTGDPLTHFFEVSVLVPNPGNRLKSGMFVKSRIAVKDKKIISLKPEDKKEKSVGNF